MPKMYKQKELYKLVADRLNAKGILPTTARQFYPHSIESYQSRLYRGLIKRNSIIDAEIIEAQKQLLNHGE